MKGFRVVLLTAAATVVALAGMAAIAPAHIKSYPTRFASLTAEEGSHSTRVLISGQVASPRKGCVRGREVRAGSFNPNSGLTSGVRSTTTNANGNFSVEISRRGHDYKVQVERKRLPSPRGHRHRCKRVTKDIQF